MKKHQLYLIETGYLLEKNDPEFDLYKVSFDDTKAFFNDDNWLVSTEHTDIDKLIKDLEVETKVKNSYFFILEQGQVDPMIIDELQQITDFDFKGDLYKLYIREK